MDDGRTHGDSSAVDDDDRRIPMRSIVGPFGMSVDGHKVTLTFENAQYAQVFAERHRVEPINALSDGWDAYYYGEEEPNDAPSKSIDRLMSARDASKLFSDDRGAIGHKGRSSIPKSHRGEGHNYVD